MESGGNAALDFFSPSFDPLAALLAVGLRPPVPHARPLDNIYRCRFMLPDGHPEAWREQQRTSKSKVRSSGQQEPVWA
jgi:hypothetical protein